MKISESSWFYYKEILEDSFLHSHCCSNLKQQKPVTSAFTYVSSAAFIMFKHGLMHESYRMILVQYSLDIRARDHKNHHKHQNPFSMHNVYLVPKTYNITVIKL